MKQLQKKDLDFIRASRISSTASSIRIRRKKRALAVLLPVLLLIGGGTFWGWTWWNNLSYMKQVDAATIYTASILNSDLYQQAVEAEKRVGELEAEYRNAKQAVEALESYPDVSKSLFRRIASASSTTISLTAYSYTASDGILKLSGKAGGIQETADFVARLRQTGLFADVSYTGYAEEEKTADAAASAPPVPDKPEGEDTVSGKTYLFQVTILLKGK